MTMCSDRNTLPERTGRLHEERWDWPFSQIIRGESQTLADGEYSKNGGEGGI